MPRLTAALVTRMADTPKGKGYGVYLNDGKVHVHLTSNYDDDAIRLETEETLDAEALVPHRRHLRRLASWPKGVQVYIDGKPAKVKVLLRIRCIGPFRNAGTTFQRAAAHRRRWRSGRALSRAD